MPSGWLCCWEPVAAAGLPRRASSPHNPAAGAVLRRTGLDQARRLFPTIPAALDDLSAACMRRPEGAR